MTQNISQEDKVILLKESIIKLYSVEGKSVSYIAKLFDLPRNLVNSKLNYWDVKYAHKITLKPSELKFLNKHKNKIKSKLDKTYTISEISKSLDISTEFLNKLIAYDKVLEKANMDRNNRRNDSLRPLRKAKTLEERYPTIVNLENEIWKEILGFESYSISNCGRVKSKDNRGCILLNYINNRVELNNNGLIKKINVGRLVGFYFLEGHSKQKDYILHLDGNDDNNYDTNLKWVTKSELLKYNEKIGKEKPTSVGKFEKIIVDDIYEFKTITAFAKFVGKSHSTARYYILGKVSCDYKIEVIR